LHALEDKAYWSADGKLLYNMNLGHMSYPPNAKHYVICVDKNRKKNFSSADILTIAYDKAMIAEKE